MMVKNTEKRICIFSKYITEQHYLILFNSTQNTEINQKAMIKSSECKQLSNYHHIENSDNDLQIINHIFHW